MDGSTEVNRSMMWWATCNEVCSWIQSAVCLVRFYFWSMWRLCSSLYSMWVVVVGPRRSLKVCCDVIICMLLVSVNERGSDNLSYEQWCTRTLLLHRINHGKFIECAKIGCVIEKSFSNAEKLWIKFGLVKNLIHFPNCIILYPNSLSSLLQRQSWAVIPIHSFIFVTGCALRQNQNTANAIISVIRCIKEGKEGRTEKKTKGKEDEGKQKSLRFHRSVTSVKLVCDLEQVEKCSFLAFLLYILFVVIFHSIPF